MKILVTSNTAQQHQYLWEKLAETGHELYIFAQTHLQIEQARAPLSGFDRVKRILQTYSSEPFRTLKLKKVGKFLAADLRENTRKLFPIHPEKIKALKSSANFYSFHQINEPTALAQLEEIQPDIVVVQGGKILAEPYFRIPRFGTIHLHGGIVPWYRGGNTWDPCILNDDLAHLGPTVQEIDEGIDTGNIIHQHTIQLTPHDTPGSMYAKTCFIGVEIILNCIREIESKQEKLSTTPIPVRGYNYSPRRQKPYDKLMVYNQFGKIIQNHLRADFHYKPPLIQQPSLMVEHSFVHH